VYGVPLSRVLPGRSLFVVQSRSRFGAVSVLGENLGSSRRTLDEKGVCMLGVRRGKPGLCAPVVLLLRCVVCVMVEESELNRKASGLA